MDFYCRDTLGFMNNFAKKHGMRPPECNFLEAKAAGFFLNARVFLKWQGFLKVGKFFESGKVGKLHTFFAISRLFLKRHRIFKAAKFFD